MEGAGFMDLINSPDYTNHPNYYILTQSTTMEFLFNRYGVKGEEKQMTVDDKVCLAGILFCDDVRFYIEDMIGMSKSPFTPGQFKAEKKCYPTNAVESIACFSH